VTGGRGRIFRFVISGGLAALTFLALSYLLLRLDWRPALANLTAFAISFFVGYVLQRSWTFGGQHGHGRAFPRYLAAQVASAALVAGVGEVGSTVLGLSPLVVSLASTGLGAAFAYAVSSLWVFPIKRA
jgi:putative flippase GtrA